MKNILKENLWYLILFALFLLICGIFLMNIEKGDAIRYFSNSRNVWLDLFMVYGTKLGEEIMYALFGIIALFIRFRYTLLIVMAGVLTSIISFLTKSYFAVDRPFTYFEKLGLLDSINFIEGVTLHKAATSFPSGHTMSAFALYTLIFFLLKNKKAWLFPVFFTAVLVGITRIYLVQHFLQDVFLGSIFGMLIALFLYWIHLKYPIEPKKNWLDRHLTVSNS